MSAAALAVPASAPGAFTPLALYGASVGTGAGQLNNARAVAVDAGGSLYVADDSNNRVSQFTAAGGFVRGWGFDVIPGGGAGLEVCTVATSCQSGTGGGGAGQLGGSTTGDAADRAGNVYVTDSANDRVNQYTSSGGFVRSWGFSVVPGGGSGFGVCTTATGCETGVPGGAAGQLRGPSGVAAVGAGNVYVAGGLNQRVDQFGAAANFVRAWGVNVIPGGGTGFESCTTATTCQTGAFGEGAGEFNTTEGIAADGGGNVYVTDVANNRVSRFTASGEFVRAWGFDVRPGAPTGFEFCTAATGCKAGVAGGAAGQLNHATGIATDGAGNVYVAELNNERVSQFTASGNFVRAFGFDVRPGPPNGFEVCTAATTCQAGVAGNGAGQLSSPAGLATDCRGAVYVTDQGNNRVQRFGEAGTPLPPCPSGGGGGGSEPSNEFSFGKVKKNKRKGTAKLSVEVPGPGEVALAETKKVKAASATAPGAGEVTLTIKPKGKAKKKLKQKGKAMVVAAVTFTPDGGEPNTESTQIKLKRKR
jgi:tripartite motif-containing protein 71